MRKITANYIYTPDLGFLKYGIIVLDDNACVLDIIDTNGFMKEIQGLEFYSGLIVVGRIEKEEFLKYKGKLKLDVFLHDILIGKEAYGLTIFKDVDLTNFLIKTTSSIDIIV